MHLEIPFWNQCNNNCVMCTNPSNFRQEKIIDLAAIKKYLDRKIKGREGDVENIYLTGGEPTMQPKFFEIISYLQQRCPAAYINILSNGRRYFYADFAKACLALGKVNFIVPVHGPDSKTHDAVTRIKGSFEQTIRGIENILLLRKPGQALEIRVIATKLTYKKLGKTLDFLLDKFSQIDRIVIIFLEYEGQAIENLDDVRLTYGGFKAEFKKLRPYLKKNKEIRFYHFPLCVVPDDLWPFMWRTLGQDEITYIGKCNSCKVKQFCLGIHKNYLELFGKKEFNSRRESYKIESTNNYHHPINRAEKK